MKIGSRNQEVQETESKIREKYIQGKQKLVWESGIPPYIKVKNS